MKHNSTPLKLLRKSNNNNNNNNRLTHKRPKPDESIYHQINNACMKLKIIIFESNSNVK
jgi:hypothetical protein